MLPYVLAGDIGGTKTTLAIYQVSQIVQTSQNSAASQGSVQERSPKIVLVREGSFPSAQYDGLETVLEEFLGQRSERIEAGAFGIAGPVLDGKVATTNLPWAIESASLIERLGGARVRLMNDLEATAYGALHTPAHEMQTLNQGRHRPGHRAVIAAGTGLGQAFLFWDGHRYHPTATEGGHVDFAPRTEFEDGLLQYMRRQHPTVSYERLVSGPGLVQICNFLVETQQRSLVASVRQRMQTEDPGAVIGQAGLSGECPTCAEVVEIFLGIYGAQTGNLALTVMALGGVYVGGGIITKLLPKVRQGPFLQAFLNKGRFSSLMAEIPVQILLNPHTCQIGAAHAAAELLS